LVFDLTNRRLHKHQDKPFSGYGVKDLQINAK
jgi:hypothetical protein